MSRKKLPPLAVGDSVRCLCPELAGAVCRVVGLRVLSCHGWFGVAVKIGERGYVVLREGEYERV